MDFLYKILAPLERILDSLPRKTTDTIRQVFFAVIAVAVVGGAIGGFLSGKKAANKAGIRLINSTNDTFDVDRRRERVDDPAFAGVTEAEFLPDRRSNPYNTDAAPANERLEAERREFVVEAERDRKYKPSFDTSVNPERIADIPRMDSTKVESEVTRIERERAVTEAKAGVIQRDKPEPLKTEKPVDTRTQPGTGTQPRAGTERPASKQDIKPMTDPDLIAE